MRIGNLEFMPAAEHPELLAERTAARLQKMNQTIRLTGVAQIDPEHIDGAALSDHYGLTPNQGAVCVIVQSSSRFPELKPRWAACLKPLGSRLTLDSVVKKSLGGSVVEPAPPDLVPPKTNMEMGSITPIGLPDGWPVLVDARLTEADYIVMGSGLRGSKLALPQVVWQELPAVRIIERLSYYPPAD